MDIGEQPFNIYAQVEAPGKDLDEYRFRLGRARRRAVRERLHELGDRIDRLLPVLLADVPSDSMEVVDDSRADETRLAVGEIERLLGDTTKRVGRWGDLHRHLYFGQGHDWHDIATLDWPTVRLDIHAADLSDEELIPVPAADLGLAASSNLTGSATAALDWANLADDGFERLLFYFLRGLEGYQNVEWLTNTHAPDRGRDLSLERVIRDSSGTTRIERVIVQAKHWTRKSVAVPDVSATVANSVPVGTPRCAGVDHGHQWAVHV